MKNRLFAATFAAAALTAAPAAAQVNVDLGLGADVDVGADVGVRVGGPYTYDGYSSGRWYYYDEPRRRGRWYAEYGGYDCWRAFYYTWRGDDRVRWESYWCYDDRGRDYEVRRTRVVARID